MNKAIPSNHTQMSMKELESSLKEINTTTGSNACAYCWQPQSVCDCESCDISTDYFLNLTESRELGFSL